MRILFAAPTLSPLQAPSGHFATRAASSTSAPDAQLIDGGLYSIEVGAGWPTMNSIPIHSEMSEARRAVLHISGLWMCSLVCARVSQNRVARRPIRRNTWPNCWSSSPYLARGPSYRRVFFRNVDLPAHSDYCDCRGKAATPTD